MIEKREMVTRAKPRRGALAEVAAMKRLWFLLAGVIHRRRLLAELLCLPVGLTLPFCLAGLANLRRWWLRKAKTAAATQRACSDQDSDKCKGTKMMANGHREGGRSIEVRHGGECQLPGVVCADWIGCLMMPQFFPYAEKKSLGKKYWLRPTRGSRR